MKGIVTRLQAIERKLDKLLQFFDGMDEEPAAAEAMTSPNRCYHWQPADDTVLTRMFKEGASDVEMAVALHRTESGVLNRRNKLGMKRRAKA